MPRSLAHREAAVERALTHHGVEWKRRPPALGGLRYFVQTHAGMQTFTLGEADAFCHGLATKEALQRERFEADMAAVMAEIADQGSQP